MTSLFDSIVPPKIEPFTFQEGLSEGIMTRLVCGVSQGDLPIEFTWSKDGKRISKDDPWTDNIEISTLDPFSTLLRFSSLSASHAGIYTCLATNPASQTQFSARLVVQGKTEELLVIEKKIQLLLGKCVSTEKYFNCFANFFEYNVKKMQNFG